MKKVEIIKNGQVAYACEGTQEEIDRWWNKHSKKFGQAAYSYEEQVEVAPAVIAEDGTEVTPAQYETRTVHVPADYEVVETEINTEQDKINEEALKLLSDTDWYVIRFQETGAEIPQDILDKRAAARAAIVRS